MKGWSENFKAKDEQESGKLAGEDEFFSSVGSNAKENEAYKEEIDESEF